MAIKHAIAAFSALMFLWLAPAQAAHEGHERLSPAYAADVGWHTLAEGRKIAAETNKPMLVDFAVPEGCPRCDFLKNNVYNRDEIVAKINRDFVPIWVDLSRKLTPEEDALGKLYDYNNDCLLLFLSPSGELLKDPEGRRMCFVDKIEPQVFIEYLDHVLRTYISQ